MRVYLREITWVAVAQVASFVGGLATLKAAAAALGPAEYGRLSVGLAIVGISQVCLYGAIAQTATRFLMLASTQDLLRDYERALGVLGGIAALVIFGFWIAATAFGLGTVLPVTPIILSAYAVISGIQMVVLAVANAARQRKIVAIAQSTEAFVRPLLILLAAHVLAATAYHAMFAYLLASCLVLLVGAALWLQADWSLLPSRAAETPEREAMTSRHLTWTMANFAAPFLVFGVLGALGSHGERLLLTKWVNWADVGSYALMSQLVMAPNVLFTTVINQFYFPLVFQSDPHGKRDTVKSFRMYVLISIAGIALITVFAALAGPFLITLFSSRAFLGHEHLLWYLGGSAGLFCLAQQLVLPGMRLNRPSIYMPSKLIHSSVLLGLSLVLVPRWGVEGMGVASLLSAASYLLMNMLANALLRRRMKSSCSQAAEVGA